MFRGVATDERAGDAISPAELAVGRVANGLVPSRRVTDRLAEDQEPVYLFPRNDGTVRVAGASHPAVPNSRADIAAVIHRVVHRLRNLAS